MKRLENEDVDFRAEGTKGKIFAPLQGANILDAADQTFHVWLSSLCASGAEIQMFATRFENQSPDA